jgi:hypothetical protein
MLRLSPLQLLIEDNHARPTSLPPADRTLGLPILTLLGMLRLAGYSCVPPAPLCALLPGGPRHVQLQLLR